MASIRTKQLTNGKSAYLVRFRTADGHERSRQFARRRDAEHFAHGAPAPEQVGNEVVVWDWETGEVVQVEELDPTTVVLRWLRTPGANAGVFAGVQHRLGAFLLSATLRHIDRAQGDSNSGVFLSVTRLLGRRMVATASYDSVSQSGRAELRQRRSLRLPEVEWAVRAERTEQDTELGGNFRYATSRFDAEADVTRAWQNGGVAGSPTVGQLRLQSGIAFADGVFAIGRDPAQGFAIVSRHSSLRSATVAVSAGTVGRELAYANGLGPAVAPLFGSYRPQELTVALYGAPAGYDIGAGAYVLEPGARRRPLRVPSGRGTTTMKGVGTRGAPRAAAPAPHRCGARSA